MVLLYTGTENIHVLKRHGLDRKRGKKMSRMGMKKNNTKSPVRASIFWSVASPVEKVQDPGVCMA
ncbi:Uncharacterised protein [Enterobacter hormaechei]|nr:Uncharacterised protein [Enterobacter hormaechei]